MAYYNYKIVRDLIPKYITDGIDDYEGSADYDGDQWVAAAEYIIKLKECLSDSLNYIEILNTARGDLLMSDYILEVNKLLNK